MLPVGATSEREVRARVIASTNLPPAKAVATGRLREDLYYRLAVVTLALPPLRFRDDDVTILAQIDNRLILVLFGC